MRTLNVCLNGQLIDGPDGELLERALANPDGLLWLDITDPTDADATFLRSTFGFHPLVVEDALRAHERSKIETHPSYYFIIFYAVGYGEEKLDLQALHLFVGRNYLVSVHRKPIPQIQETLRRWQAPDTPLQSRIGALVYALLDAVVDDYFPVLDALADRIDRLEDAILLGEEDAPTNTLFSLKKDILSFRRVVAPQRDILNLLLRREQPIFAPSDMPYFQDVYDHLVRITENIDLYRDLLSSALDSHLSLQSNRLNQILRVLTVASIILMANALLAGIYGMNFARMPELEWTYGYPFALGLMACVTIGLVLFFRKKRWL